MYEIIMSLMLFFICTLPSVIFRKSLKKDLNKYKQTTTKRTDIYTVIDKGIYDMENRLCYIAKLQNPKLEKAFSQNVSKEFYETLYRGKEVEMTLDFNEFGEPVDLSQKSEDESSYRIITVMSTIFIIVQIGMFLGILGI